MRRRFPIQNAPTLGSIPWSLIRDFAEVAAAQGLPVTEYADVLRASDRAELERLRRGAA